MARSAGGSTPCGESGSPVISWSGATGLAEDVRRYGLWMRDEAKKRIGHLYPAVEVTAEMAKSRPDLAPYKGRKLTVIAWLWARTVPSPHPSFSHVRVPLVSSFVLSSKKGKEVWIEPVVEGDSYRFEIRTGKPQEGAENGTKLGRGAKFRCLLSGMPMEQDYLRAAGTNGEMQARLMAIVCEGDRGRVYLPPNAEHERIAVSQKPTWKPDSKLPDDPRNFWTPNYGLSTFGSLFTDRQLVALNTFSDLVQEARAKILIDATKGDFPSDDRPLADGGTGPRAYADAVAVYLAFVLDKAANYWSSICSWHITRSGIKSTFGRQAIPMAWDFAEGNPIGESSGNWQSHLDLTVKSVRNSPARGCGSAFQSDAQTQSVSTNKVVSTDPPYYDNIGYADLSDFFYVWMRRSLRDLFPSLFSTMAVPKAEELVATPYRHGGVAEAEAFFLDGMTATMHNLAVRAHPAFPVTIYYAFKQSETNDAGTSNAGWETFLEALIRVGFVITGTWPMSTEQTTGLKTYDNVLASSIVLVCRKRDADAPETERRAFLDELKETMADALRDMKGLDGEASPIAPVDLAQAAIGPGMEVYSKYSIVRNADGSRMPVHDAIQEINRLLDGDDDFDAATRFCRDLFASRAWGEGPFGEADVLARAKGTTVDHVRDAGVLKSAGGKVRLLRYEEYPEDYDPAEDRNRPAWEACHHRVRVLRTQGTTEAGKLLARMPEAGEAARALAYSLYVLCERKGLAQDAGAYNELVTSWSDILSAAAEYRATIPEQGTLGL